MVQLFGFSVVKMLLTYLGSEMGIERYSILSPGLTLGMRGLSWFTLAMRYTKRNILVFIV